MTMDNFPKPGTIAVIRGSHSADERTGFRTIDGWYSAGPMPAGAPGRTVTRTYDKTSPMDVVRPLLVIDPEDPEQVERLVNAYYYCADTGNNRSDMQAALRSLLAPPIPEPMGLGAVVEASAHSNRVRLFVRCPGAVPWVGVDGDGHEWSELDVVRVLAPGWVPEDDD